MCAGSSEIVGSGVCPFGQQESHRGQHATRQRQHKGKNQAPAEKRGQQAADRRRQQRRSTNEQEQQRKNFRAFPGRKEIMHHRNGADLRRAAAQALQQAQRNQHLHILRQRAAQRRGAENNETGINRFFPPVTVEQRPVNELPRRHADEIAGQRQGDNRAAGLQVAGDVRKCGQVQINRERTDHAQRPEQAKDEKAGAGCGQDDFFLRREGKGAQIIIYY